MLRRPGKTVRRSTAVIVFAVLAVFPSITDSAAEDQKTLLLKAKQQYLLAQELETALSKKAAEQRTRNEYMKVVKAYERVYLITPRTSYADDSLMTIARLYEEMKDPAAELRTLNFLVKEY